MKLIIVFILIIIGAVPAFARDVLIVGNTALSRQAVFKALLLGLPEKDRKLVRVEHLQDALAVKIEAGQDRNSGNFTVLQKIYDSTTYQVMITSPVTDAPIDSVVAKPMCADQSAPRQATSPQLGTQKCFGEHLKLMSFLEAEGYPLAMNGKQGTFGVTLMPIVAKIIPETPYSPDSNVRIYIAGDVSLEQMAETLHHEFRHAYLSDGGLYPEKGLHLDPIVDRETSAAEREARLNARVRNF